MSNTPWWGTTENVSNRLRMEYAAMQNTFDTTFTLTVPATGDLYWTGIVTLNLQGIPAREHTLKIIYPVRFPFKPPEVYVLKPRIRSERHQYRDGSLCLFDPRQGPTHGWNPAASTGATMAYWAIEWLYCYYTWKLIGKWPEMPK